MCGVVVECVVECVRNFLRSIYADFVLLKKTDDRCRRIGLLDTGSYSRVS